MRDITILLIHLLATFVRLLRPGGVRAVAAESALLRHQLLVLNRGRSRAPKLRAADRVVAGLCAVWIRPSRLRRAAVVIQPATILSFHRSLVKRKYRRLFGSSKRGKAGPNGPAPELIAAVVEMKRRNPRFGCRRIAQQISLAFGIEADKDTVRHILAKHCRFSPDSGSNGPSWLTFLGHTKDSLWSIDFFRCESARLKTHWVLVVMDQYTRRIIGFAVTAQRLDGPTVCCMFNRIVGATRALPHVLSSDNDPLFTYHRWRTNLRILDVQEVKTIRSVPLSHPFVERLIGTVRRELLDQTLFWSTRDLEKKLKAFQQYYNAERAHIALGGKTPAPNATSESNLVADLNNYRWRSHCRGLFQLLEAA